jgi:hypothetical protein
MLFVIEYLEADLAIVAVVETLIHEQVHAPTLVREAMQKGYMPPHPQMVERAMEIFVRRELPLTEIDLFAFDIDERGITYYEYTGIHDGCPEGDYEAFTTGWSPNIDRYVSTGCNDPNPRSIRFVFRHTN